MVTTAASRCGTECGSRPASRTCALRDLPHTDVSHAVMNGESLHVAGRMPGHRRASTTNRYVQPDDATLSQAAERAAAIQRRLFLASLE